MQFFYFMYDVVNRSGDLINEIPAGKEDADTTGSDQSHKDLKNMGVLKGSLPFPTVLIRS
jgi:hypoxanthine-guanine phosphoribosyltransferase